MSALHLISPASCALSNRAGPCSSGILAKRQKVPLAPAAAPQQRQQVWTSRQPSLSRQGTACRSTVVDTAEAEADVMELELKVEGMVCEGCSSRVADALKAMSGVDKVNVNLSTGIATVEVHANDPMDAAFNKMPPMVEKIKQLGFKAQAHFEDW